MDVGFQHHLFLPGQGAVGGVGQRLYLGPALFQVGLPVLFLLDFFQTGSVDLKAGIQGFLLLSQGFLLPGELLFLFFQILDREFWESGQLPGQVFYLTGEGGRLGFPLLNRLLCGGEGGLWVFFCCSQR